MGLSADVGDGYAEPRALGLDLALALAAGLGRRAVPHRFALVVPGACIQFLVPGDQVVHQIGSWCCTISWPKRSAAEAAFGSSMVVNPSARPAGCPLRKTGSGEPAWKQ